jgi:hypothetical protein
MKKYYFVLETSEKTNTTNTFGDALLGFETGSVFKGVQCKTYVLSFHHNNAWYEKKVTKYDFTSLYVKIKSLPKILDSAEIARNIQSDYSVQENTEKTRLTLVINLTIQKVNKKIFEQIEIILERVDFPLSHLTKKSHVHSPSNESVNADIIETSVDQAAEKVSQDPNQFTLAIDELVQTRAEYKNLLSKNYELNGRYCFESGFQYGFVNSQEIVNKTLSSEISKMRQENEYISCSNERYLEWLPQMIKWRESIESYNKYLQQDS